MTGTNSIFGLSAMMVICGALISAAGAAPPRVADFQGRWIVSRMVGASQGGVTDEDPRRVVGRVVEWNNTAIRRLGKTCVLHDPAVRFVPNADLEFIWGRQTIAGLLLPPSDLTKAFGSKVTPVFEDRYGCAYAVLVDHDRQIMGFDSGYLYLLRRAGH